MFATDTVCDHNLFTLFPLANHVKFASRVAFTTGIRICIKDKGAAMWPSTITYTYPNLG